jgi:type I restriction enzyme S subunit
VSTDVAALINDSFDLWTTATEHKSGAGRGGGKKINLYGIERLRALILDLAIRGKLVPQLQSEGSGRDLLEVVPHELRQIGRAGAARRSKSRLVVKKSDFPFEIPPSWQWVHLDAICVLENGDRGKNYPNKSALKDAGVPFVNAGHLKNGVIDKDQMTFISEEHFDNLGGGKFTDGDILFCLRGSLGKAAIVSGLSRGAIASSLVIVRSAGSLSSTFLMLYFNSRLASQMVKRFDNGTAQPNLSSASLGKFLVPLPPLAEQQRIAAEVAELMALCDVLETQSAASVEAHQTLVETLLATLVSAADHADFVLQWARLEAQFDMLFTTAPSVDSLRQTILELAVRGKLVTQSPGEDHAGRSSAKRMSQAEPPFDIPSTWRCVPLGALGELRGGGTPSKARSDYWDGPLPWVSPKDMKRDYLSDAQLHVSEAALSASATKLIPRHSILFVVRGMILAHSFPAAIATANLTINQDMKALILDEPEMSEYILRALKGLKPYVLERIERSSHGTCRLDSKDYKSIPIPVPPLPEQRRIVAKLDELMALCDALKARLADAAQTRRYVADAVVERAAA